MEFNQYYVVFLRKGPRWTAESTPELEELQNRHLAHLTQMHATGKLAIAGPVDVHSESAADLRGISIFRYERFGSLEDLRALVENDPKIQAGHLIAEYVTWYVPASATLGDEL